MRVAGQKLSHLTLQEFEIVLRLIEKSTKKKAIKSQYEFLKLKVSCSIFTTNKERIKNNNKCRLITKLPAIKDKGKV